MADTITMVYEDARGGPYMHVRVNGKHVSTRPLNPDDTLDIWDIGAAVSAVAREIGADVEVETTQVLYDARGNRVEQ